MVLAKLIYPEALEQQNKIDFNDRQEHDNREKSRISRIGNLEKRKREAEKNLEIVGASIESRFRKIIKSIIAMARKEPDLTKMLEHDAAIVAFLAQKKLATLSHYELKEVAPSLLEMEKPFIDEFMEELVTFMGSQEREIAVHKLRGGLL